MNREMMLNDMAVQISKSLSDDGETTSNVQIMAIKSVLRQFVPEYLSLTGHVTFPVSALEVSSLCEDPQRAVEKAVMTKMGEMVAQFLFQQGELARLLLLDEVTPTIAGTRKFEASLTFVQLVAEDKNAKTG